MAKQLKTRAASFKFKVVLESFTTNNVAETARKYSLNANQLSTWRGYLLEHGPSLFQTDVTKCEQELEKRVARLTLTKKFAESDCLWLEAAEPKPGAEGIRYLVSEFLPKHGIDPVQQVRCSARRRVGRWERDNSTRCSSRSSTRRRQEK